MIMLINKQSMLEILMLYHEISDEISEISELASLTICLCEDNYGQVVIMLE